MYNNKKETVKLLLLIILVLTIPLIFISFEIMHHLRAVSNFNTSDVVKSSLDEIYEKIASVPKNNDASNIRKHLNEIFELMNNKEYSKLYSLLTDDIKESMFPTEESFSNYLKTYLGDEKYSPDFSEYQKLNNEEKDVFIVNVNFLPYSTSEIDIINSNTTISKTDTFTIYQNKNLTYNFSFIKYIGTGKSDNSIYETDNFSCKLVSTDLYMSQTTFNIELKNKSNSTLYINSKELYIITGLMKKAYTPTTIVPANSTVNITFTIYTGLNLKDSLPFDIYFRGVHTNGKVHLFTLPIKYPVKISNIYN